MAEIGVDDFATFTINGKVYTVNSKNVEADTSLNTFIRDHAQLKGTKYMCKEGGCGACIVTVQSTHPVTKQDQYYAVNSCLMPVLSCHGKAITTVEGIGSKIKGYHKIQQYLAKFNGTQCGYCSPAMVMNMYSLMKANPELTMTDVEYSFAGNICRCTGYRSILDAFKSLASDATEDLKEKCRDIEDLMKECQSHGKVCNKKCADCKNALIEGHANDENLIANDVDFIELALAAKTFHLKFTENLSWYRVSNITQIFQVFDLIQTKSYRLVCGDTAKGIYKDENPSEVYIDISEVAELKGFSMNNDYVDIGANTTLSDCIVIFRTVAEQNPLLFGYASVLANHLEMIGNLPVKNIGTLAGNLSIKHEHNEFPSDLFVILSTVGAKVLIHNQSGIEETVTLSEYLDRNMYHAVITKIILPALSTNHYYLKTYKIMPRKQNVHALVNAGFLFRIDRNNDYIVEEKPTIVFGNISATFSRALQTESYLVGKPLMTQKTLSEALSTLAEELKPESYPTEASPEYRKKLAMALFYRCVLSVNPDMVDARYRSGAENLQRPLSSGKQEYVTNKEMWPVTEPVQKLEALIQCSGEAEYTNDKPKFCEELYGAFVLADRAKAVISNVDASAALNYPGIVAFYTADDIPGKNSFIQPLLSQEAELEFEEVFCSGKTLYAGQPIGIIVGETQELAIKASRLVKITYSSSETPLLSIEDVLESGDQSKIKLDQTIKPTTKKHDIKHVIKGRFELGSQYHNTMELQTCLVIPTDEGMTVHLATQWPAFAQNAIALALNVPVNSISVECKRLGGGFGSKASRSNMVAVASAVAAVRLNRPIRMVLDLETNMRSIGKRYPVLANYEVGVNDEGEIQYLNAKIYENCGTSLNDPITAGTVIAVKNFYDASTWTVDIYTVLSDIPSTTWARGPGFLEGIAIIEYIFDHIAFSLKKDPIAIRKINCNLDHKAPINEIVDTIISTAEYTTRLAAVKQFNKNNRWRKKGISLVPINYIIGFSNLFSSLVSVFGVDGTVGITTAGIEMGQGLNTKVAQVAAYALGIGLDMIKIKPCISITSPDNNSTSGSVGSETVAYATLKCCEEINARLKPVRDKMVNPTWVELVQKAVGEGVSLCVLHTYTTTDQTLSEYNVYGAGVLETEVDLLTGTYQILRADILEDTGESLSPNVDIGQIEGAFVMGLGYYHSEELIYDPKDGRLLTDRTWTYWPPGALDIPIDFRVAFRKNSYNKKSIFGSKATGEPPLCISVSLLLALRMAIQSAREDNLQSDDKWCDLFQPCTFEKVFLAAGTDPKNFLL